MMNHGGIIIKDEAPIRPGRKTCRLRQFSCYWGSTLGALETGLKVLVTKSGDAGFAAALCPLQGWLFANLRFHSRLLCESQPLP